MKQKIYSLLFALCSIMLQACNNGGEHPDPNPFPDNTVYDIVTFVDVTSGTATFELQENNDSKTVTLTAKNVSIEESTLTKGSRILLYYVPQSGVRYVDDEITIYSYGYVYNAKPVIDDITLYPYWSEGEIYVYNLWRTGKFLNIYSYMQYDRDPQFKVIADSTSIENEYPDIYLTYEAEVNINASDKNFNASIDISQIWDRNTCRGLTVHVNNSNGENSFTLHKNQTIKPIE